MIQRVQKVHFTPFDRDPKGRIKWGTLSEKLQETAWKHAESLGLGMRLLKEHGLFWAMTRQWIRFKSTQMPEEVGIFTWPRGFHGNFANREFEIRDDKGQIHLRSTTSWLLVNLLTRSIGSAEAIPEDFKSLRQRTTLDEDIPKIEFSEEDLIAEKIKARYYDLDINGHVNNTRYLTWLGNCLYGIEPDRVVRDIFMNVNGEISANDEIDMMYKSSEDFYFGLKKNDRTVFKARVSP